LFAGHCQDGTTGLYKHGFNAATGDHSCCLWGRANGWVMMAHAEVALALAATAPPHPALPAVLAVWRRHAGALAALAPPAGAGDARFHQVLDDPTTFHETSVTAMTCYSMAMGILGGFLDRGAFDAALRAAWAGVAAAVGADGVVEGICEGTGIGETVAFYEARTTFWNRSSPGLGSVFRCASAMGAYLGQ
jgi:rhamnogalacturonyl hydrolase YesR